MPTPEEDLSAYAEDAELSPEQATNILSQITDTVRELITARESVLEAERVLKAAQDQVKALEQNRLPLLMDEAQQKLLVTTDGWQVSRDEIVRASISKDNLPAGVAWLNKNGHGSIVKRSVTVLFGRGEEQRAAEAIDVLREHKMEPEEAMSVNAQTLSALVRELLKEGKELPNETLGVYIQPVVKVTKAKK